MALTASFVSTHVYYTSNPAEPVMEERYAWTIVGSLSASWLCGFAAFLLLMKPLYLGSFFALQSGHAWVKEKFIKGNTDELKAWTLGCNKEQWMSIRDDAKAWTLENWERWEEEQPEWFSDNFKALLDDDMIPAESLMIMNGGSKRRRSSLGDLVVGVSRRRPSMVSVQPVGGGDE
jgi:hypothetical protein